MPRAPRPPKGTRHKTGQRRIRVDGKDLYLGLFDDPASLEAERRIVRDWHLRRVGGKATQVYHLIERFVLEHGIVAGAPVGKHQAKQRKVTQHVLDFDRLATRRVVELIPADFESFLDYLAGLETVKTDEAGRVVSRKARYTRRSCNELGQIFRGIVKWGERKGHVPVGTWHRFAAAETLKRGKSPARETDPVEPVSDEDVERTIPELPDVVADMVRFQRLVGCRPGEVCRLRLADTTLEEVVAEGERITVRVWRLQKHKTAHMGKRRVIAIGPKALLIIQRRESGDPSEPVFRTPSGDGYTREAYTRAIARACKRAGVPHWFPNRLRHARATELNRLVGLETAGAVLGHAHLDTTQIYAKKQTDTAMQAAALTG